MKRNCIVTLLLVALLIVGSVNALTKTYSSCTSSSPMRNSDKKYGACFFSDESLHDPTPITLAESDKAYEAYQSAGFTTDVPFGGSAAQAACLDSHCFWSYTQGIYVNGYPIIIYRGVNSYDGTYTWKNIATNGQISQSATDPSAVCNWDTGYPKGWLNVSSFGARVIVMSSNGKWRNNNFFQEYTNFICEGYEYDNSDALENGGQFPTYPNGDVILMRASQSATDIEHCGKPVEVDVSGNWIDQKCTKDGFPWWAGLLIAVICFIIVVAVIIIIVCCCLHCRNKGEEKDRKRHLTNDEDNVAMVPTQSQIGMSRDTALDQDDDDDDDEDDDEDIPGEDAAMNRE